MTNPACEEMEGAAARGDGPMPAEIAGKTGAALLGPSPMAAGTGLQPLPANTWRIGRGGRERIRWLLHCS